MSGLVTVIVPTLAEHRRRHAIERALASLRAATTLPEALEIVVVVNGDRHDAAVLDWLAAQPVRVVRVAEGSAPLAQLVGRRHVATPYFCFLDDDDEYLPGAIDTRLAALARAPSVDVVATNGWRCVAGQDALAFNRLWMVAADPLAALFDENWLASCGAMFRSDRVDATFFEDFHPFLEWTWLAFRITTAGRSVATVDEPTFRIHDTPGSASKSARYAAAERSLYERMLAATERSDIRGLLCDRIQNQWHMRSVESLRAGDMRGAWSDLRHVLAYPRPWRYVRHFIRLVLASIWRREGRSDRGSPS